MKSSMTHVAVSIVSRNSARVRSAGDGKSRDSGQAVSQQSAGNDDSEKYPDAGSAGTHSSVSPEWRT